MGQQNHRKIGRYQVWMENGTLKLYSHKVGSATGIMCTLNAEEITGLLEMLSKDREETRYTLLAGV